MPNKPTYKSVGATLATYDNIQQIAQQLAADKGVPITLTTALSLIVNFYLEAHQKGKQ